MPIYPGAFEVEDIPANRVFLALRYSRPAASLVAHFEVDGPDGVRVKRLFTRPVAGGRYVPLAAPAAEVSQDSVAIAHGAPIVVVNEFRVSPPGYEWLRLQSIDLVSGDQSTLLTTATLPRQDQDLRAWITEVVDASPDGGRVICTRAREEASGVGESRVVYEVVELDVADRSIAVISELKNTSF